MNKEFIPHEQAVKLKELGFDEECFICKVIGKEHLTYTPSDYEDFPEQKEKEVLIPLYQQAFRFFRENYNMFSKVDVDKTTEPKFCYSLSIFESYQFFEGWYDEVYNSELYYSYEEAELACLEKLIEIAEKL